ncbi:SRPBCC family protein [Streptomyces sp. NPDC059018]|uniref:SRPBCC family protein n=1 Tax=Streptomyces sp. NPDC059018 TaxID=3346701 RepID=UPI00367B8AE0
MELRHEFTVPVPVEEAWRTLLDIERVAPCLPGTTVQEFDGEKVTGTVKVKVGPVTLTYRGTAVFEERDEAAHRMVLKANGKEVRGQGTARATVTAGLTASEAGTAVSVRTDFAVTGRPAQIGRGVMAEVGDRLVGRFADCLSERLAGAPGAETADAGKGAAAGAGTAATGPAVPGGGEPPAPAAGVAEPGVPAVPEARAEAGPTEAAEPIDLLRTAGLPVTRRIVPLALAAGAAAAAVAVAVRRRRR